MPSAWPGHLADDVFVREAGAGTAIVFLHGGWGYEVYPVDGIAKDLLPLGFRLIVPDRVGYGRSSQLAEQPLDFHRRAAAETTRLLDTMDVKRPILWGHSDGAVIAAWMALAAPDRFAGLVLEATHYWQNKPRSTPFFEGVANGNVDVGDRARIALEKDHGARWKQIIEMNARAWVGLAKTAAPRTDLYAGALATLGAPSLLFHGVHDPRTEPGELEAARETIPETDPVIVDGKHAPHVEPRAWEEARERVLRFLTLVASQR